ncbi:hypothetical protein [Flavobacterium undicola]|uniref:hypothetical protein n=1 Tax=Flavobacterium undicola TaxID=1932779 RepID=UPI0013786B5D|nr:hypothetical protein [Flavobacterium undicola]MBA0884776.1 hypothetical protein [Flavobacterium undicola]
MKKILGILGVVVIAVTMFLGTDKINSSSPDNNLSDVIAMNSANAEWVWFGCGMDGDYCGQTPNCRFVIVSSERCLY